MPLDAQLFRWIEEQWDRPYAAVVLPAAVGGLFFALLLRPLEIFWASLLSVAIGVAIALAWIFAHRLPKVSDRRIGFAVAVTSESEAARVRVSQDLVRAVRSIFDDMRDTETFQVIELSRFHSERILDAATASKLASKMGYHFLAFGTANTRRINGREHYVLRVRDLVIHRPIPMDISKKLAKEMETLLPQRVQIDCEHDLRGFELTSVWFAESAKFVIATAALISGDIDLSERLLESLDEKKKELNRHRQIPGMRSLVRKLPGRLFDTYNAQVARNIRQWQHSRRAADLQPIHEYALKIRKCAPQNEASYLMLAIWYFVCGNNVPAAINELRQCESRKFKSAAWRLSLAFLHAYEGDLKEGKKYYAQAFRLAAPIDLPIEIEDFIGWVISREPKKYQLYYCLGLVNYNMRGDFVAVIKDWEKFVAEAKSENSYPDLVSEVENNLAAIKVEMDSLA